MKNRKRRGTALVLVLIAVVVLAVLSTGAILGSMQELRAAHNEQMAQRALTVAEYGLNQQLSNWSAARNQMANGAIDSSTVAVAAGDTATVKIMRLNGRTFSVVSIGRTNRSSGRLEAQRQVGLLVSVSAASVTAAAALTANGNASVKGSPSVTGINTAPIGWSGCPPARDTFAIAANPAKDINVQKPASQSVNGTYRDPNAAKTSTYTTFGTETWSTLVAKANVSAASQPSSPSPSGNSTTCTIGASNWGEPLRNGSFVAGCTNYFPIIYASNNLKLTGGRGQGVILVNGNLDVMGNFYFVGLIVATGNVTISGTSTFRGAIMAQGDIDALGNTDVAYSSCAVGNAFGGTGTPARTKQRAWAQLYQ